MKKLLLALCLMLALLLGVATAENTGLEAGEYDSYKEEHKDIAPMQVGNFWYIVLKDGTAEIVKYTGTDNELTIPAKIEGLSVTSIGRKAFNECDSLTSVVIPNGVTSIGSRAFEGCDSLTSVVIPDCVTSIGYHAFAGCDSLTSVVIPNGVTSIGTFAFGSCDSLTSVVIPDSVTIIDSAAFQRCDSLTSVVIPDSVTSFGSMVFSDCPNLTLSVTPYSTAEKYAKENNIPYIYTPATEGWTCSVCQNYNEADFCTECGARKPVPTPTPAPTPVNDGSWDCTCGSHNTGKFCGKCGTKRPEPTVCPTCGYQPEDPAANFCSECGTKL